MAPSQSKPQVIVSGKLSDDKFQRCKKAAERLASQTSQYTFQVNSLLPTDYELHIQSELLNLPEAQKHKSAVLVLLATPDKGSVAVQYIGGDEEFFKWASSALQYTDQGNGLVYKQLARAAFKNYCLSTNRKYLSLTLATGNEVLGTLTIELFTEVCPQTCDNFLQLVLGTHPAWSYKGTPIHRVVPGAFIQGGDVVDGTGKGKPGYAIPDESFAIKHDRAGILAMANLSAPHSGSTQFFITLNPLAWLDGKRVAFGRVIDGMRALRLLERVETQNERPAEKVALMEAELLDFAVSKDLKQQH